MTTAATIAGSLTDATGVSKLTAKKIIKDAIADFLLTVPAALIAVNIAGLPIDQQGWLTAGIALGNVAIKVVYRALLRWAQTD